MQQFTTDNGVTENVDSSIQRLSSQVATDLLLGSKGRNPHMWATRTAPGTFRQAQELLEKPLHRISCHRCGNIRKRSTACTECPYVYCGRCIDKMVEEHGKDVFQNGCPVVCSESFIVILMKFLLFYFSILYIPIV